MGASRTPPCAVSCSGAALKLLHGVKSGSFYPRVICRVDVGDAPGPHSVELDDDFLLGPDKVVGLWLHDADASRRQRRRLLLVELVAGAHVDGAGQHRNALDRGMRVRRRRVLRAWISWEGRTAVLRKQNPAEAGSVYLRLNCRLMHREPFRCRYGFLRQREFQDAVVELGLGGRFVDLLTERERALDRAVIALGAKHSLAVLDVFFVLHFRGYRNFVAVG